MVSLLADPGNSRRATRVYDRMVFLDERSASLMSFERWFSSASASDIAAVDKAEVVVDVWCL